jgi:hypothetical protein
LEILNKRQLRQAKKSRWELCESRDRPKALPLPQRGYEYAEWYKTKGGHTTLPEHMPPSHPPFYDIKVGIVFSAQVIPITLPVSIPGDFQTSFAVLIL